MNRSKNENGYALVTVLLIITVFIILFLSFVGQSFSTVKQNEVVEKNSQSVALAEMGITYFQKSVENVYNANIDSIIENINIARQEDIANEIYKSMNEYLEDARDEMLEKLKSLEETIIEKQPIDVAGTSASFSIEPMEGYENIVRRAEQEEKVIMIEFISKGSAGRASANLGATIEIKFDSLTSPNGSYEDQGENKPNSVVSFDRISRPDFNDSICKNPNNIPDECNEILITNESATTLYGNNNGATKKTIFSEGPLTIEGNGNKMGQMTIHSEKSITFGGNLNHVDNLFIEAKGPATLDKNVRADLSEVFVGGDLSAKSHFELSNSDVYVGGSLVMGGNNNKLTIDSSTVCVNGDLVGDKINLTVSNNGKLIVRGNTSNNYKQYKASDKEDFFNKCGFLVKPADPEWINNISSNIDYDYLFNES